MLTDSGGYQIFSLPGDRTVDDGGARFVSYIDGRIAPSDPRGLDRHAERAIGSDIMMVLDECPPSTADLGVLRAAMERTHRWALRSLAARTRSASRRCSPSCRAGWIPSCAGSRRRS